jgi:hypothetical protein
MEVRPPLAEAWAGFRQAAGSPASACAVFCARLAGKGACGRIDRQPVFLPVAPLFIVVANEEVCGAGFGFSFFGLRFSRLPRCSLLAMGTLRFCDSSTIAPSQPVLPIDWCRGPPSLLWTARRASTSCGDAAAPADPRQTASIPTFAARPPIGGGVGDMVLSSQSPNPMGYPYWRCQPCPWLGAGDLTVALEPGMALIDDGEPRFRRCSAPALAVSCPR